ncbi:MAG: zf-HC2 domain-containing protein [Clostridia bacterium]|nr:zf-HC2 domain-containing protein [Clostridia bacterium]
MNCEQMQELLDRAIDQELTEAEWKAFNAHIAECPSCHEEWEAAQEVRAFLSQAELPEVPQAAKDGWRLAVRRDARRKMMTRITAAAAAVLVLTVGVTAATRKTESMPAIHGISVEMDSADLAPNTAMVASARMSVVSGEEAYSAIEDLVAEYDGVIEGDTVDTYGRTLTVSMPKANADDFSAALSSVDPEASIGEIPETDEETVSFALTLSIAE